MALFTAPLIDSDNPLYCPEVSAQQYMSSIRLFQASVADASKFPYFHRLCNAFMDNKFHDSPQSLPLQLMDEQPPPVEQTPGVGKAISVKERQEDDDLELGSASARNLKRESDRLSSDSSNTLLRRPPKRAKRSSSHIDMSFVLSDKAEHLRFSDKMTQLPSSDANTGRDSAYLLAEELFWPEGEHMDAVSTGFVESRYESGFGFVKDVEGDTFIEPAFSTRMHSRHFAGQFSNTDYCTRLEDPHGLGPETPRSISALLKHLEKLLPGMRLQGQLDSSATTHQDIVNILGIKGHLNPQILYLFRNAQIQSLNLTESMADADGLNLLRNDTLKVFKNSPSFLSLRSIVLSDVPLYDDDLACLSDLSGLESLFLDDTQISDVAVMHLVALRRTLAHLELSWNDRITDDVIPTLCNFPSLNFLSLKRTAITVKGLRKLSCSVKDRGKKISIILPSECEEYICNLHNEYEMKLISPLMHDPSTCSTLSESTLKENLAAHAVRNSEITTDGTKDELEKRLRKLLERRQKDMVVQGFMLQGFA